MYYAHSFENETPEAWETMSEHEERVAQLCAEFLGRIHPSLSAWGDLLGRWHDLGKYSNAFQAYLLSQNGIDSDIHNMDFSGRVDHSTAAAQLANERFKDGGLILGYPFAGHHAGLPDWDDETTEKGLRQRLKRNIHAFKANVPPELLNSPLPPSPKFEKVESAAAGAFRISFWIRMIFSGLVDADFLATESFMSPTRGRLRPRIRYSMRELSQTVESIAKEFESSATDSSINQLRCEIGHLCFEKAQLPKGAFSLCVPTGGGKTIASLRFALKHAELRKLHRVIVAIPFTSIIDQNARIYREIFKSIGNDVVLEHHCNLDPEKETTTNRLQAENWDAPLIVTTNVQLFESLFACKTSRCRKLHRIANSVIILDEAQSLPVELLHPTLLAIRELIETYNCTVVFCSATQPALNYRSDFPIGIQDITPIVENPVSIHQQLKRTRVEYLGSITDEELVHNLEQLNQTLCIVNTRPHAAKVFNALANKNGSFHLSTRMCAAHRVHVLENEIKPRLLRNESCRVISTQLIEAGVDIDFPCVYRAIAGLDSLTQAAGRCNREGKLKQGTVYFFDTETPPPAGILRQTAQTAKELIGEFDDLLSPNAIEQYFQLHYWKKNAKWDTYQVLEAIGKSPNKLQFNFRQIAERYRFIRDVSESILVPWGIEGERLIRQLDQTDNPIHRDIWRKLQRYNIQVRQREFAQLLGISAIEKRHERWVLIQPHLYDEKLGLTLESADGVLPPDDLIA